MQLSDSSLLKNRCLGREGSHHGIEEFVELKYVMMGGLNG